MRFVLAIALLLFAGCGHDSTRTVATSRAPITGSPDSTWVVIGGIIDADSEEPLDGANATLQYRIPGCKNWKFVKTYTNFEGRFWLVIHSYEKPKLERIQVRYIGYKSAIYSLPQFHESAQLHIGPLELSGDRDMPGGPHTSKPMIERDQTNFRAVATQEEIHNLPVSK